MGLGMWRALGLGTLALALGLAGMSRAVDGVVEINAARASAGGVTPADEPGYPVTIDRAGSYRLTGTLAVLDGTALEIEADHVTLDLNGFRLRCFTLVMPLGTPCSAGLGVDAAAYDHVVVRDGSVVGFGDDGLRLRNNAVVEDVQVVANGGHGIEVGGASRVEGCLVEDNGGDGILGSGTISHNRAVDNGGDGIRAIGVLRDNEVIRNGGDGIQVTGEGGGAVLGNHVANNEGCGLRMYRTVGYGHNTVTGNNGQTPNRQVDGGTEVGGNVCGVQTCETGTPTGRCP